MWCNKVKISEASDSFKNVCVMHRLSVDMVTLAIEYIKTYGTTNTVKNAKGVRLLGNFK